MHVTNWLPTRLLNPLPCRACHGLCSRRRQFAMAGRSRATAVPAAAQLPDSCRQASAHAALACLGGWGPCSHCWGGFVWADGVLVLVAACHAPGGVPWMDHSSSGGDLARAPGACGSGRPNTRETVMPGLARSRVATCAPSLPAPPPLQLAPPQGGKRWPSLPRAARDVGAAFKQAKRERGQGGYLIAARIVQCLPSPGLNPVALRGRRSNSAVASGQLMCEGLPRDGQVTPRDRPTPWPAHWRSCPPGPVTRRGSPVTGRASRDAP